MDKNNGAIYDARKLGKPKMIILGIQHMFAMFGATILVPIITGLDISTTLLMAGLGTLLFHCITKFKVPAFLGSSFAFLGGYAAIKALAPDDPNSMLPYACLGVACAGLVYFILAAIIKAVGIEKVMSFSLLLLQVQSLLLSVLDLLRLPFQTVRLTGCLPLLLSPQLLYLTYGAREWQKSFRLFSDCLFLTV